MTTLTQHPDTRELTALPGAAGLYARALLPKPRRLGAPLPERSLTLRGVAPQPEQLARYREVCGFEAGGSDARGSQVTPDGADLLPATYPHLTAFPLSMALMTARDFPLPLLGLVHLANRIEQLRPLPADVRLDYQVRATAPRQHAKGQVFEILAEARESGGSGESSDQGPGADGPAWRSISTYLHRGPGGGPAPRPTEEELPAGLAVDEPWTLPAGLGRAYGAVSGDRNPIHLHALTARLFGFRRAIAHGMWSKARALAVLERQGLPEAFTLGVDFRQPVLLPGAVRFRAARLTDGGWAFQLTDPAAERRHLLGRLTPH